MKEKTFLYLMSESPDFGMHFQRNMELCLTVMALQDKLQNEKKEGNTKETLLCCSRLYH